MHTLNTTALTRRSALGAAALSPLLALSSAACRQPVGGATAPKPPVAPAKLVHPVRRPPDDRLFKLREELYADFTKEFPHIQVELVGGIDLKPQLVTRHAAGDPYSFVENDWGTWTDLAEAGAIVELGPFYAKDKIDPAQTFIPRSVEVMSLDGKIYGLPVSVSADALAYNLDLFDAAGVKYPPVNPDDKSWNMDSFLEVALKLTNPPNSWGFSGALNCFNIGGVTDGTYFGMPAWDDNKKKAQMDTPEFRRGLQYFLDLLHRYKVQPNAEEQASLTASLPRGTHLFLTGKIAMAGVCVIWSQQQAPFRWALATIPYSGPGKNISARMWPHALHMGAVKHQDAVWELFRWLIKPENGGRYPLAAGHSVSPLLKPGASDLVQKERLRETGIDPKAFLLQVQNTIPSASGMLKYPGWPDVARELTPKYDEFRQLKLGTAEYARFANETIERLLIPKR